MMKSQKNSQILGLSGVIVAAITLSGCGQLGPKSRLDTVEIPQTVVKAQNKVGFCWSYATMAFIESLMLKKTGQALDLSEEALGFYRMSEELLALSYNHDASELASADAVANKVFEGLEGWDLMFNPEYNPGIKGRGSLQLVKDFGVVPESVWSYKFTRSEQREEFFKNLFAGFSALMQANGRGHVTRDMIFDLLASPTAFGSRPPTEYDWTFPDGQRRKVTAVEFATEIIGFTPDDYTYMIPDSTINFDKMILAIKKTLARGVDVPLSYTIYDQSENRWDASYSTRNMDLNNLRPVGGHAVLITDFVNKGGRPGLVSQATLATEVAKSSSELDFIVFKNSWNTSIQSPLLRYPGYFTMDQSYIQLLTKKTTDISVIVPRDIAFDVRYSD